ncbi:MAG: T6SS effector BTH_I2691 family protein [Achromobacter piechaudii]
MTTDYDALPCKGKFCGRPGLPILPMRVAYVPGGKNDLPNGVYADAELHYETMRQGAYMLRAITAGYVYLWDPRRSYGWRAFAATATGQMKEVPVDDDNRPTEQPTFTCTREGHGLESALINVDAPANATRTVWVGYSRVWWTRDIRRELSRNERWRSKIMVELDARAVWGGGHPRPDTGYRVTADGANLAEHSIEFRDAAGAATLFNNTLSPGVTIFGGKAAELAVKMRQMTPKGGIVLALRDPVGLLADIATWRNKRMGDLAEHHMDPTRLREVGVAQIIQGLEKQMDSSGDEIKRMHERINMGKVSKTISDNRASIDRMKDLIEGAGKDWAWWYGREAFWMTLKAYSPNDAAAGARLEEDLALCVDGAGAVHSEHQAIDESLKEDDKDGLYEAIWRGLASNDGELLAFLQKEARGKLAKQVSQVRKMIKSYNDWLKKRSAKGLPTPTRAATTAIGRFMATQLLRLTLARDPIADRVAARVTMTLAARMNTVLVVRTHTTTVPRMIADMHEIIWDSKNNRAPTVTIGGGFSASQHMSAAWIGTQSEASRPVTVSYIIPQEVDAQLNAASTAGARPAPTAAPPLGLPAPPPMLALPAPTMSPMAGLIKYAKSRDASYAGATGVMALVAIYTSVSELNAARAVADAKKERKAWFGITTGVLGVGSVAIEVTTGAIGARVGANTAFTMNLRLNMRLATFRTAGAVFATAATFVDSANNALNAKDQYDVHNYEAGGAYATSSAFLLMSSLTGVATAVIAVGGAFSTAGVAAGAGGFGGAMVGLTSGGTVLLGIPVWGWIALGLCLLVAGLYFKFWGDSATESELEVWYTRCCMRAPEFEGVAGRELYLNREDELDDFNRAVFGVRVSLQWYGFWSGEVMGRDRLVLEMTMPGYTSSSDYAYSLKLGGKGVTAVVSSKGSPRATDPELQPRGPSQAQMVAGRPDPKTWMDSVDEYVDGLQSRPGWADAWRWIRKDRSQAIEFTGKPWEDSVQFQVHNGYATLRTEVLVDDDIFTEAFLKIEFWPDPERMPEVRALPVGSAGSNLVKAQN